MDDDRANTIDGLKTTLTVLVSNTLARCCAPSASIQLFQRFKLVSVYSEW
jgi:hypothetical protein